MLKHDSNPPSIVQFSNFYPSISKSANGHGKHDWLGDTLVLCCQHYRQPCQQNAAHTGLDGVRCFTGLVLIARNQGQLVVGRKEHSLRVMFNHGCFYDHVESHRTNQKYLRRLQNPLFEFSIASPSALGFSSMRILSGQKTQLPREKPSLLVLVSNPSFGWPVAKFREYLPPVKHGDPSEYKTKWILICRFIQWVLTNHRWFWWFVWPLLTKPLKPVLDDVRAWNISQRTMIKPCQHTPLGAAEPHSEPHQDWGSDWSWAPNPLTVWHT